MCVFFVFLPGLYISVVVCVVGHPPSTAENNLLDAVKKDLEQPEPRKTVVPHTEDPPLRRVRSKTQCALANINCSC